MPSGTEAYYSFDYGNVHLICLDSSESDRSPGGAMLTWLQQDLAATTQDWIVAFWHHPPYSKGSHSSDSVADSGGRLFDMRQNVLPILEAGGVDLVLAGHSHSYERSFLLDGHYGTSSTLTAAMKKDSGDGRLDGTGAYQKPAIGPAPHEGAVYIVAGSSGQISGGSLNHPAMFISLNTLGSVVLDVNQGPDPNQVEMDIKFLTSTGLRPDYLTIRKGTAGPPVPPLAPGNLTATASSATRIDLSWSDNSTNEDGFKIERSPDGATDWAQIATAGRSITSYTNTGLAPATTYFYQVRAFNSAADSPYLNVADAATPAEPPPGPDIGVTPTNHNYGSVAVGASVSQTFVVSNTGTTDLSVSATTLAGMDSGQFSIVSSGAPFTVTPGQTQNVMVSFNPSSLGAKSASLDITSNDPVENPLTVPLSGTGVTTPPPGVTHEETLTGASSGLSRVTTTTALTGVTGHVYLAAISTRPNVTVSGVSGLGLTWTQVATQCSGRNATRVTVFRAQGTPSGNGVVTATFSSTATNAVISVSRYSGALTTTDPIGNVIAGNTLGLSGACSGGTDSNAYK